MPCNSFFLCLVGPTQQAKRHPSNDRETVASFQISSCTSDSGYHYALTALGDTRLVNEGGEVVPVEFGAKLAEQLGFEHESISQGDVLLVESLREYCS
jgi:hypothetical protein